MRLFCLRGCLSIAELAGYAEEENSYGQKSEVLFEKLERAVNEEDVENIFDDITEAKAEKRCQCKNLQSFYSPGYYRLSIEEQYQHERAIFLTGKWKLKKLYAKLHKD